jgi:DNA-binding MarR family transcriptional regulator
VSAPGPGQVLFEFVRHWSRRSEGSGAADQGRLVLVTEAVDALARRGVPATVNAIAAEIGIDQSGASRLVGAATGAGHLTLRTSADDARRREAHVTAAGRGMLEDAHRWQEEVFEQLTEGWTQQQRRDFGRSMTALIDRSRALGV